MFARDQPPGSSRALDTGANLNRYLVAGAISALGLTACDPSNADKASRANADAAADAAAAADVAADDAVRIDQDAIIAENRRKLDLIGPLPEADYREPSDTRWFGIVPGTRRCASMQDVTGFSTPYDLVGVTNANGVSLEMTTDRGGVVELKAPDGTFSVFVMGEGECRIAAALILARD